MNPLGNDAIVSEPLTIVSTAYIQSNDDFIADKVFPIIPVRQKSGNYRTFDRSHWYRTEAAERAPATETRGSGFSFDEGPLYSIRVYGFHKDVDDQTRAEQDDAFVNLDATAARFVTRNLLLKRELIWANAYFRTGIWGKDNTGVAGAPAANQVRHWTDAASTPIDDIGIALEDTAEATGLRPNVLVLTPRVLRALRRHPEILEAAKVTDETSVSTALLQNLLEVPRIVVARALINNSAEGAAAAYTPLFGKSALLTYASDSRDIEEPSGGYTFTWTAYEGADFAGNRISTIRVPLIRSDRIEGEMAFDMRLVAPGTGTFFSNVIP